MKLTKQALVTSSNQQQLEKDMLHEVRPKNE
jgi:hypothetical protein